DGRGPGTETREPSGTLAVIAKQAVNIGTEHPPVRRSGPFVTSSRELSEWTRAIASFRDAHVHFIATERRAVRRRAGYGREPFVPDEYCFDVEKPEPIDRPGRPFDALGIGNRPPELLVPAAQAEQQPASPHVRADVDLQPAGAQDLEIGDR